MPNIAAIDGVTGPGRRTVLIQGEITEITFRFGKKVIDVTNKDGSMGSYDLAQVTSIQVTSDGKDFTLALTSKEAEENERPVPKPRDSESEPVKERGTGSTPARK